MRTTTYPVAEIFYSIQGEGRWTGRPMVFLRLAGCSVRGCHIRDVCDTDWSHGKATSLDGIAAQLEAFPKSVPVSITGGEPTDHNLTPLMALLKGREIHMETSGVREVGYDLDWLTVSPKTVGYKQRIGGALKIVVRPEWAWVEIEALEKDSQFSYKYLQPMTSGSLPLNTAQVIGMVLERPEWNLSTQAHRVWKLR